MILLRKTNRDRLSPEAEAKSVGSASYVGVVR